MLVNEAPKVLVVLGALGECTLLLMVGHRDDYI